MAQTPDVDPAAEAFVDSVLRQIGSNTDRKVLRIALLMAYTAGYRDAVHAEVQKTVARIAALDAQVAA
jgi:hypothetical protein